MTRKTSKKPGGIAVRYVEDFLRSLTPSGRCQGHSQPEHYSDRLLNLLFWVCLGLAVLAAWRGEAQDGRSSFYRLDYSIQVEVPRAAGRLRLWIPYPIENEFQRVGRFEVEAPRDAGWRLTKESRYGNRMVYLEGDPVQIGDPLRVSVHYWVERKEAGPANRRLTGVDDPRRYRHHTVPPALLGEIRRIARETMSTRGTPGQKWRALYDFVVQTMSYNKEGEGWGRGDPVWACANRRGNCTDFHSLLIELGRTSDLAGRFAMGLTIPQGVREGSIPGYHCWAEGYDPEVGWFPIDASEAKKRGRPEDYYRRLPSDRIQFSWERNLTLEPRQSSGPVNFFIYPLVEVGDRKVEAATKFSFRRLDPTAFLSETRPAG